MKPRRVFLTGILCLSLFFTGVLSSCAPAKKPTTPERVVVPEVSKVFVETKELTTAPAVVQELAKRHAKNEAQLALVADGNVWIFVTTDDEDELLEVKEVTRRVINESTTVLEIKLTEAEIKNNAKNTAKHKPLVAKLSVNSLDNGVLFYEEEKQAEKREATKPQAKPSTTPQPAKKIAVTEEAGDFQVEQPKPDASIKSPVEIKGRARLANSAVNIRLRDSRGNILAETETVAGSDKRFSTSLSFEKPPTGSSGRLEVFAVNAPGGSSANTKVIPITFE